MSNRKYFSPTEMDFLKRDLDILRTKYDLIFIIRDEAIKGDRLFLEQICTVCDGLLIGVGAQKTLRKSLRFLERVFNKKKKHVMTILSDDSVFTPGKSVDWEE